MKEDTKTPGANGNGAPEQDKIELEGQGFMADFRRRIFQPGNHVAVFLVFQIFV